uniref:Uncharacterized protein n=1 Tax=Lepeophtheirus salmonis TaxID=72036 RepID=A0A0K2VG05_LEPSM
MVKSLENAALFYNNCFSVISIPPSELCISLSDCMFPTLTSIIVIENSTHSMWHCFL